MKHLEMKKMRIVIPFEENKNLSILAALKAIGSHSDLEFEKVGELLNLFHDQNDIRCDISTEDPDLLIEILKRDGFTIKLLD